MFVWWVKVLNHPDETYSLLCLIWKDIFLLATVVKLVLYVLIRNLDKISFKSILNFNMFQMWRQKSVPGNKYLISNVLKISRPLILHEKALGPTNSRKISLFSTENISRKYLHVIFPHGACTNYLLRIIRMRKLYMVFIL